MSAIFDKISKIEALIARASSEGERQAALAAKERILKSQDQRPQDYVVSTRSSWQKKLFVALCHKYNFVTYRHKGQKYTTARVRVCPAFMNEVLWPEYCKYSKMLESLVQDVVDGLISKIHHGDQQEVEVAEISHDSAQPQEVSEAACL